MDNVHQYICFSASVGYNSLLGRMEIWLACGIPCLHQLHNVPQKVRVGLTVIVCDHMNAFICIILLSYRIHFVGIYVSMFVSVLYSYLRVSTQVLSPPLNHGV